MASVAVQAARAAVDSAADTLHDLELGAVVESRTLAVVNALRDLRTALATAQRSRPDVA